MKKASSSITSFEKGISSQSYLIHYIVLIILSLNLVHFVRGDAYELNIYNDLCVSKNSPWWAYLIYPFIQPLFLSPSGTLYSSVALLFFWFLSKEILQRIGKIRFIIFLFSTSLAVGWAHDFFAASKPLYGMSGLVFGLMAFSWKYYPTRMAFEAVLFRKLVLYCALFFASFSLLVARTPMDTYSPIFGYVFGWMFIESEIWVWRFLQKQKERQNRIESEKEVYVRSRIDSILEKISSSGGMENLTPEEKEFLLYASKRLRKTLKKSAEESQDSNNQQTKLPKTNG